MGRGRGQGEAATIRSARGMHLRLELPHSKRFMIHTQILRSFLYHPKASPTDESALRRVTGIERWWHESPQGPVEAWFIPGRGVSERTPGPVVVYAHGNAEVIDYLPYLLRPYLSAGVSVFLPEYRGYGRSAGTPSQRGITRDMIELRQRLLTRAEVDSSRLVYHGVSLGGGVLAQLANPHPPSALILQSTFTSISDIAWNLFRAPSFAITDKYDSMSALARLDAPTLILHGRRDELVPYSHGLRLHHRIPKSQLVSCDAGHNDLEHSDIDYWEAVLGFLQAQRML